MLAHTDATGRERPYLALRIIPPTAGQARRVVTPGDRLDLLAHRHLGDPEQFWRLCDANRAFRPEELTAEPGRSLSIPLAPIR